MTSKLSDAAETQQLHEGVNTLRKIAERAKSRLCSTNLDDEDDTVNLTQMIDEANRKVDALFHKAGSVGVVMPARANAGAASTAELMPAGVNDKRLFLERQILDLQEACNQLQDAMREDDGPRDLEMGNKRDHELASRSLGSDEEGSDDLDASSQVMSPRGVYVQRCMPMSNDEATQERDTYMNWVRLSHANIFGTFIFVAYVISSIGYLGARCWWSLDGLGNVLWYGAIVLAAEMCSILSLIFYGVFLCGRTDNSDTDIAGGELEKGFANLRRLYTLRVFVICEDESLSLARRTIASVRNAYLPEECTLKIYLLDVCKDKAKRDFFVSAKAGADVIYIAAPPHHDDSKIINLRSEVINFALGLIYPAADEDGFKNIPSTELISVINGDQTISSNFLVDLTTYMDSGDNVGVTMAPRICYNLDPDCDIFDRQKVAFSEKLQPGMDAYGFTVCSHMSVLFRARALQEVGWFPQDTLSPEWEVGMALRSAGWKSRLVPEYSSISEPPTEICENLEQRYRDARGYFQSFWSYQCPLLNRDLGLFFRVMYASAAFTAFASGVWTLVFTIVPIVHLIAGVFPLTFNLWVTVGMTACYTSRLMMLCYSNSLKQLRALWLSRIAYTISWWPNLKAALLTPVKSVLGGASFRSRSWSNAVPARNFKALRWPFLLVVASLVAFIGGCINLATVINLPTVLSLCLVLINMIPHLLVILYWNFGQGQLLTRICTLFMYVSGVISALAIAFLWVLYPREVDFTRAADMSLSFLDAQRSGVLPQRYPVEWRHTSGLQNNVKLIFQNETSKVEIQRDLDLSGGFYNDGEIGAVKVTWNIAMTTTMLSWSLLEYPDFWSKNEAMRNHALLLVSHGLQYIDACYQITPLILEDGQRAGSAYDVLVYAVGTAEKERQLWRRPEDVTEQQFVGSMYLDSSPSDLAGQIVAALTAGSLALREYQSIESADAFARVNDAHRLFRSAVFSPGLYTEAFNGTYTGLEDHYPSFSFGDDLFWAATWLFRASNMGIRTYNRTYYYEAMRITMDLAYADLDVPGISWDYVNNMASVHAATQSQDLKFHLPAQSFIWDWICDSEMVKYTRNGRAFFYQTPHLGSTAAAAAMSALYVKANRGWNQVAENKAMMQGMECFANEQARYLLGGQVSGITGHKPFMVGYNDNTYTRTWHRGASCPAWPAACDITVAYSDNPDANTIHGALLWNPIFEDRPGDVRGRNTTVISLENNMALPLLFPGVELQATTFSKCLNTMRTAFLDRPFCRQGRPANYRLGPQEAVAKVDPEFEGLWKPKEKLDERIPPPPPPSPRPLVGDF